MSELKKLSVLRSLDRTLSDDLLETIFDGYETRFKKIKTKLGDSFQTFKDFIDKD